MGKEGGYIIYLTDYEYDVLSAIITESFEYGLPVDEVEVKALSGIGGELFYWVIASLVKRGLVEEYDLEGENVFHLTEEMFNEYVQN